MDNQSFLDDLFRRMDISKKRPPANFKYNAINLPVNMNSRQSQQFDKNKNYKNSLFVSAEPFTPGIKNKHRYAFTIENKQFVGKKYSQYGQSQLQSQSQGSQNIKDRKQINSSFKSKQQMFLQVQPYKKVNPISKFFPNFSQNNNQRFNRSPDLVGQYISLYRSRDLTSNFKDLKNYQTLIPPIRSSEIITYDNPLQKQQIHQLTKNKSIKNFTERQKDQKKPCLQKIRPTLCRESKLLDFKKKEEFKRKIKEEEEKERKEKLLQRKFLYLQYLKPFNPPNNISAYSYIIYEPSIKNITWIPDNSLTKLTATSADSPQKQPNKIHVQKNPKKQKFPNSGKIIISQNSRTSVQVASLTKIMTCVVALEICERFQICAKQQRIVISKFQSNIGGTSAQVQDGEIYTLHDLYYGLMLPSGNDASVAIACWGGRVLLKYQQSLVSKTQKIHKKKACYNRFIGEMNAIAKRLGLQKTTYANSHGLVNSQNKSCAFDLAVLCEHAMNNEEFRKIVGTKRYTNTILWMPDKNQVASSENLDINNLTAEYLLKKSASKVLIDNKAGDDDDQIEEGEARDLDSNQDDGDENKPEINFQQRTITWQNTHKLIHSHPSEYLGIKTGITTAAGPCLSSCIRTSANRIFIIIVLNCDKLTGRFRDTQNLKKWVYKKQGLLSPKKKLTQKISDFKIHEKQQNQQAHHESNIIQQF